jgi:hypothetical protein
MNAFTRLLGLLPFVLSAAAISVGCGGSDGVSPPGGDDEGCVGEQPTCGTSCGVSGSVGASCSGGNWICPAFESNIACPTDGGIGDDDGGYACPDVEPDCSFYDCNGQYVSGSPSCEYGIWQCPELNEPACWVDGGPGPDAGSCTGPQPECQEEDCNGNTFTTSATCLYDQWQCIALPIACIQDAGPTPVDAAPPPVDAAPPPDAGSSCGTVAPVCIGRDCKGNPETFQPTCTDFGWACIEPPVACPG